MRRRGERYVEEHRPERTRGEQLRGDGGPADLNLCDIGMPVRNGNLSNDRTTTTKAASVRRKLDTKNSKSITRRERERDCRILVEISP